MAVVTTTVTYEMECADPVKLAQLEAACQDWIARNPTTPLEEYDITDHVYRPAQNYIKMELTFDRVV